MDGDQVEIAAFGGQIEDVAMAHRRLGDLRLVQVGTGNGKHVAAGVDTEAAAIVVGKQLKNPAGAVPRSRRESIGSSPSRSMRTRSHLRIIDMQAAKLIPLGGVSAEIGLRPLCPLLLHGQKPLAIPLQNRISRVHARQQGLGKRCRLPSWRSRK